MKRQGYIDCKKCGAILMNAVCEYCSEDSNYVFMTQDEFNKVRMENVRSGRDDISYGFHSVLWEGKEVVLRATI